MKLNAALACLIALSSQAASSQEVAGIASESRDAASGFIGSMNFTVGRIARDCLADLGRTETPQQFAESWQQRNTKYVVAAAEYIQARFKEATAKGDDTKNRLLEELASVRRTAEADLKGLYDKHGKDATCKRMTALIDGGAYDITPGVPMFKELEALSAWSQSHLKEQATP